MTPVRLASLVPSLTELAIGLGLRDWLVARTGFCIHPADQVRDIAKVGGTKDVNLPRLRALRPTHVLVNVDENRLDTVQAIGQWPDAERPRVVVTHPGGPRDLPALIDQLTTELAGFLPTAARHAMAERAGAMNLGLTQALARAGHAATRAVPRRVLYLIWRDPWMTVARDTYIARMLAEVGWTTWPAHSGGEHGAARYPALTGHEPWLCDIDEVLLSSEPYAFGDQHVADAAALCPNARVRLVDGERLSWYGPRTAEGLQLLADLALQNPLRDPVASARLTTSP